MADAPAGDPVSSETTPKQSLTPVVKAVGVLGLVLAVVGAVLFVVPARDRVEDESAATQQVVSRVSDFAVTYNTYDVADPGDYQQRMAGLLTDDYDQEFKQVTSALFEAIKGKKQTSGDAVVREVAVESIDTDSAVALVVVDAQVRNTDNDGAVLRQFRWSVSLSRQGGQWRVAQFESVPAQPADAPEGGSGTPSAPTPTGSAPSATPSATPGDDQ